MALIPDLRISPFAIISGFSLWNMVFCVIFWSTYGPAVVCRGYSVVDERKAKESLDASGVASVSVCSLTSKKEPINLESVSWS